MLDMVILYGGKSGEHEVSLASAASIFRRADTRRFRLTLVGIAKDGAWYLQDADSIRAEIERREASPGGATLSGLPPIAAGPRVLPAPGRGLLAEGRGGKFSVLRCDLAFPVLHGTFGEDGTIQGLLETAGLPYVGAGVLASALGMDKEQTKEIWMRAGLPVVDSITVRRGDFEDRDKFEILARRVETRLGWPAFVKPACTGSSVGASRVSGPEGLEAAIRFALEWDVKALVESFIKAREIECAVLGNDDPVAFPPGEILPSHEFYDYDAKYLDPNGARLLVPAPLTDRQSSEVRSIALAAYKALELSGMARVDFFMEKKTGELFLNEVNTIPGFTAISMYPRMCEAGGLAYRALIDRLADLALERHARRAGIRYDFG